MRAGLKNRPKPEPEELPELDDVIVDDEGSGESVEPLPEVEPVADDIEPLPEVEPVADDIEPLPEVEPVADDIEPLPEVEPVADDVEPLPEVEPVADDIEPITEIEPVAGDTETAPEVELALDTPDLPAEILEAVGESPSTESESDSGQDTQTTSSTTDYSGENLKYDFTSGERYVDKVSTKTEFDKMLDELANISKDLLSWQVEKFAKQHTGKFQGDFDKAESDAKKYEAFLGGYITNAAMTLYDNGYRDAAIKQLDQAKSILEARKKLEEETEATRTRVAENDDVVDLTDILGLFGD